MAAHRIRQGDVWRVAFYDGGERPAVVISRNELNGGSLVLVVPCTASRVEERQGIPNHAFLAKAIGGLVSDSVAQTHLVQPVEVSSLIERTGRLQKRQLEGVLPAMAWTTALFEGLG
jgi:mRNA-degrading endonuclease toxin of MazEF toxin-antitoxin module